MDQGHKNKLAARWSAVVAFVSQLPLTNPHEKQIVTDTMQDLNHDRFTEIQSIYQSLDEASQAFVADVITVYSTHPALNGMSKAPETAARVTIACLTAPIFATYLGRRGHRDEARSYAEEVALHVSYVYRIKIEAIDWSDQEIIDYTRGAAIGVAARRKDATSFENVIWLGQNSDKLKHIIDQIAEVSAEREYLQTVLDSETPPLRGGLL